MESFDAFISYSHAADGRLAPELQRGLQRLAKGVLQRRALRVFRDETGLSTNPHLWGAIEEAISGSAWFVLLASPESSRSEWVQREVSTWIATKPLDHLLIAVTDGDIEFGADGLVDAAATSSLPAALIDALESEPRWLDLRWARTDAQLDLRNGRFRAAIADLAAPMHGVAKDDLEGEDVRQQRRARRLAISGVASVGVLAIASVVAAFVAIGNQHEADVQRNVAGAKALAAEATAVSPIDADLALLLGAEGYQREQSLDTESGLLTALDNARGVSKFVRGLPGGLIDLEVSPDGKTAYVSGVDGTVRAIDTTTWTTESVPIAEHLDHPLALAKSADGRRLAVDTRSGVTIIDLKSRTTIASGLVGETDDQIALNADGTMLGAGSASAPQYEVWDVAEASKVLTIADAPSSAGVFMPRDRIAVQALGDTTLNVYALDGDGKTPVSTVTNLPLGGGLALSPDQRMLALGGLGGSAIVLDAEKLEPLTPSIAVRGSRTGDFAFNDDSSVVAFGSDDGSITLVDPQRGVPMMVMSGMTGALFSGFVDRQHLLSVSTYDDAAVLWDVTTVSQIARSVIAGPNGDGVNGVSVIDGGTTLITAVGGTVQSGPADHPDRPTLTASPRSLIRGLDVRGNRVAVYGIDFATDGSFLGRGISILDTADLKEVARIDLGDRAAENIALSPDGTRVAVGQRDGRLSVYDTRTGDEQLAPMDVDVFPLGLGFLVWSTDGSRLFTGGQDGTLRAFETSTWKRMWEQVLAPDQSALRLGHLLEDEVTLIVPVESGEVFLVNSVDGNVQGEPFSAAGTQLQNAVMADHGRKLVAMSRDGKLRIWDVATHRQLGTALNGHVLVSIALDKIDEEHVISGGGVDGRIITWDLSGDNIVDRACALAGRNLTRSEWLRYVGGEYHVTCPEFPVGP